MPSSSTCPTLSPRANIAGVLETFKRDCTERPADVKADQVAQVRQATAQAQAWGNTVFARVFDWLGLGNFGLLFLFGVGTLVLGDNYGAVTWQCGAAAAAFALSVVWFYWNVQVGDLVYSSWLPERSLSPLSESNDSCAEALELVNTVPAARALRDTVVARGEELLAFHLAAMKVMHSEVAARAHDATRRRNCAALHGIAVDESTVSAVAHP